LLTEAVLLALPSKKKIANLAAVRHKLGKAAEKISEGSKLWKLTKEGALSVKLHEKFGKIYKSKSDGLWWAIDNKGHGGSKFKVFKETPQGLAWIKDADEYGNFIINKHKGPRDFYS
jgi:hypothetical protein